MKKHNKSSLDLSVVVPLFNEEENVELLFSAIKSSLDETDFRYEIIFVDDGSSDQTVPLVRAMCETHPELALIRFRRNYGQTPAMAAGIDHARG
ncbi:MAG: glycosyltransferase, partial [Planctomycetota bacterium]